MIPPPFGRGTDTHPRPLPKGGETKAYPFIYDRRTKGQDTPSLREGQGWFHQTVATAQKNSKYQAENQQASNGKAKQLVLVCNKGQIAMQ